MYEENSLIRCTRCKKEKCISNFIKEDGNILKHCLDCRITTQNSRNKNKSKIQEQKRIHRKNNNNYYILQDMASHAHRRAKDKNLPCNIDINYLKEIDSNICPYFNVSFVEEIRNQYGKSLDRIDSNLGYVRGNLEIISRKANTIKSNSTIEEQLKLINWLENYKPKQNHINDITKIYSSEELDKYQEYFYRKRYNAIKDNKIFDITFEYFLTMLPLNKKCEIFDFELFIFNKQTEDNHVNTDKIIPDLGYIENNIAIISQRANTLKSNATLDELKIIVNRRIEMQNKLSDI